METVFDTGFQEYDERLDAYEKIRVLCRDIAIKNLGITKGDYEVDANVYKVLNSISLYELEKVLKIVEESEKERTKDIHKELSELIERLEEINGR